MSAKRTLLVFAIAMLAACGKAAPGGGGPGPDPMDMASAKTCEATCAPPGKCCGAKCLDVSGDNKNCGGCGKTWAYRARWTRPAA
jgi:hypothetical protein